MYSITYMVYSFGKNYLVFYNSNKITKTLCNSNFLSLLILAFSQILKSTQYKKLAPNALRFTYFFKSCKPHEKNKQKTPSKY